MRLMPHRPPREHPGDPGSPGGRRFARRRVATIAVAVLVVAVGLYLPLVLLAPLAPTAARATPFRDAPRTAAAVTLPDFGASAIGAVGYPGVLESAGNANPLPIASISKIVTALVVLKAKPLAVGSEGPSITVTADDAALTAKYVALNGETKPLRAGSTISQLDLMRVTLVASANNYADTLARWGLGSHAAFESAVGSWLAANGLWHTTILEPTGIDPGNVSTASDLVRIGKLALADPVVSSIVATRSMTLAGVGSFANTNTLLGRDGVEGIKTGTLNGASNLLFAADYTYGNHAITVVGAVIGGVTHAAVDRAVTTLLAGVKSGFHEIPLAKKGQSFASFMTAWSDQARAVSTKTASVLVWGSTPVTAVVDAVPARVSPRGSPVGRVTFTAGSQKVTVPLELDQNLSEPGFWWRVGHPADLLE